MRKLLGFAVLIFCILIYAASSVESWTIGLYNFKFRPGAWLTSDKYKYGDLYGMSYLSEFKLQPDAVKPIAVANNRNQPVNLYAVCDSYLWAFADSARYYRGVDQLITIKTNNRETLSSDLNSTKINVLLLEFSERNVIDILTDTAYVRALLSNSKSSIKTELQKKQMSIKHSLINFKRELITTIFNKKINPNIESNLWDYSFFTPVKQLRADVNYKMFGIVNKDVSIDKNGKQLYYGITIDTTANTSSFKYLPQDKVDSIVSNLNYIYSTAKKNKFNEIYLSIIPNPVSILNPNYKHLQYNNLVKRIQSSPKLQVPCIDILPDFKNNKYKVFSRSDTHWNITGLNIWLTKFNNQLQTISIQK